MIRKIIIGLTKLALVSLCLAFGIGAITKHQAHAYSTLSLNQMIPPAEQQIIQQYDTPSYAPSLCLPTGSPSNQEAAIVSWISPEGQPWVDQSSSITPLNPGQSINLQLNILTFLCWRISDINGTPINGATYSPSSPPADGTENTAAIGGNLRGTNYSINGTTGIQATTGTVTNISATSTGDAGSNRYWFAQPITFNYTAPNNGATSDTIVATYKSQNIDASAGSTVSQCVGGPSPGLNLPITSCWDQQTT